MNFVEQLSAVALLADFFLGVACGVVGGASHGSRREDRDKTLLRRASDAVSDGARVVHGLYIRDDGGYLQIVLPRAAEESGDDSRAQGQEQNR